MTFHRTVLTYQGPVHFPTFTVQLVPCNWGTGSRVPVDPSSKDALVLCTKWHNLSCNDAHAPIEGFPKFCLFENERERVRERGRKKERESAQQEDSFAKAPFGHISHHCPGYLSSSPTAGFHCCSCYTIPCKRLFKPGKLNLK